MDMVLLPLELSIMFEDLCKQALGDEALQVTCLCH